MSEATQTKISEDLRRLAENVGKWPPDSYWGAWLSAREGQAEYTGFFGWPESMLPTHTPAYTKEEWAAARKALGFDAEEWPEDRIDLVSLNGATGDHYGEEGRVDLRTQKGQEPGKILGLPEQGQKHDTANPTMADRYPRYYKDVRHLDAVDVYRVHRLFDVTDNEIHHASKKLLLCGVRTGGKPARKEVEEARDTLNRWLEIQAEDERCS